MSLGRDVKPEIRMRALKGARWCGRVQRWKSAVETAVPRDWLKRVMWLGSMVRDGAREGDA